MSVLRNTIRNHVRKLIIKKSIFLTLLAALFAFLAYISSSKAIVTGSEDWHSLYMIGAIVLPILLLIFIAFKIRFFHNLFSKEWTGTVIKTENVDFGSKLAKDNIRGVHTFTIIVQMDGKNRKKKLSFNQNKISPNIYSVGDRINMIKGTRYPINLTREEAQHICPMCARDSCYGDFCPDCNLKY